MDSDLSDDSLRLILANLSWNERMSTRFVNKRWRRFALELDAMKKPRLPVRATMEEHRLRKREQRFGNAVAFAGPLSLLQWAHGMGMKLNKSFYCHAAEGGNLDIMRWLRSEEVKPDPYAYDFAVSNPTRHNIDVLEWLLAEGFPFNRGRDHCFHCVYTPAAKYGNLEAMKLLKKNGYNWDGSFNRSIWFNACAEENFEMLEWLKSENCPWDEMSVNCPSKRDDPTVIKWMFQNGSPKSSQWLFQIAAGMGYLKILDYLLEEGLEWDESLCNLAASKRKLESIVWAKSNGWNLWNEGTFVHAVKGGDIGIMEYLKEVQCPWDTQSFKGAVGIKDPAKRLEVMEWLHRNGCPFDESAFSKATKTKIGSMETVEWLFTHGCNWSEKTSQSAARSGNWQVLRWLHEKGCPWETSSIFDDVVKGEYNEGILDWLKEKQVPYGLSTFSQAARYGDISTMEWLSRNNCPMDESTCAAATSVRKLKWLRERQCPWSEDVCIGAICSSNQKLFKWAILEGCPFGKKSFKSLDKDYHQSMIRFVTLNRNNCWE